MHNQLPNDAVMLLSYINMQLRDHYDSFEDLCLSLQVSADEISKKLAEIDYIYDEDANQFK